MWASLYRGYIRAQKQVRVIRHPENRKLGGALRTGRFLNFDNQEHVKLLVAVAQLMGMTSMTSVGNTPCRSN